MLTVRSDLLPLSPLPKALTGFKSPSSGAALLLQPEMIDAAVVPTEVVSVEPISVIAVSRVLILEQESDTRLCIAFILSIIAVQNLNVRSPIFETSFFVTSGDGLFQRKVISDSAPIILASS